MSYILEALKKLEEKQHKGTIPHIPAVHNLQSKPINKRPLWPYFILLALLLNVGLLLWWLQPWQSGKARIAVPAIAPHLLQTSPSTAYTNKDRQARPLFSPPSANNPEMYAVTPDVSAKTTEPDRSYYHKQTPTFFPSDRPEQKAVGTHELPQSLRQELPDLTIAGHYYDSNPVSRLVIINGKTLREGQTLSPGLKLEQITASGVLLSYQGYRFHKEVFQ